MKTIRFITIFLLFFIGLNALAGGYLLMEDPSGKLLGLSAELLGPDVFEDFLIPGLLLFLFNGVLSILAAAFVVFQLRGFAELVILQGMTLFTWMMVQLYFFEQTYPIQYVTAGMGIVLFVCGVRLRQLVAHQNERS